MLTFEELYDAYAPEVYRFSFWLAGNSQEADDITSETFVRAWVNSSKIRTKTLKAYLFTIARNIFLEGQRKSKRQIVLEDVYPDPSPDPSKAVESQLEIQRIQGFLQTLPEIDRTAFIMRVQHEFSCAEIARALGLTLSAAKVKIHRVRKKIISSSLEKEIQ
jgi:RNA polymerase sigma-70 factor (ECF subfamily)